MPIPASSVQAHLVERLLDPLHDMERIEAELGLGRSLANDVADPGGRVSGDDLELRRTLGSEQVEEQFDRGPRAPFGCPDQPAGVVVDDDDKVLVALAERYLVEADAPQVGQPVGAGPHLVDDPLDDAADGAPADAHLVADRLLVGVGGHPGDGVLERPREARAVPGPGHAAVDHTAVPAADPLAGRLDPHLHQAGIERSPAPRAAASVVERARLATQPAARA